MSSSMAPGIVSPRRVQVLAQQPLPGEPADRLGDHLGVDRMRQAHALGAGLSLDSTVMCPERSSRSAALQQMSRQHGGRHRLAQRQQLGQLALVGVECTQPAADQIVQSLTAGERTGQRERAPCLPQGVGADRRGDQLADVQRVALRDGPDRVLGGAVDRSAQDRLDQARARGRGRAPAGRSTTPGRSAPATATRRARAGPAAAWPPRTAGRCR